MDGQPQQILCIACEELELYGEAIQIVLERNLCWLRPLALVQWNHEQQTIASLYDLRDGADLLCPHSLLRPALDTEMLPVFLQLERTTARSKPTTSDSNQEAGYQLQAFLRRVCQLFPEFH